MHKTTKFRLSSLSAGVLLTLLAACSGGGGSSSASSQPSPDQKAFESVALTANGGSHFIEANLTLNANSTGLAAVSSRYFYSNDFLLGQSPAKGTQAYNQSRSNLSHTLTLPATGSGTRYLVNGAIVVEADPELSQITYSGSNFTQNYFAQDGATITRSTVSNNVTFVPLAGTLAATPAEPLENSGLGQLISASTSSAGLYAPQAAWAPNAGYMRVSKQAAQDILAVFDCVGPATTGPAVTPCASSVSSLEAYFPHLSANDGKTYALSDGQIVTYQNKHAWVASFPLNGIATPEYRVYYEDNGNIYSAILIKEATTFLTFNQDQTKRSYDIFFNSAAISSLQSAVTF